MYCFNYNKDPETEKGFIFSALDTPATREDFNKAEAGEAITATWKALLIENLYTSTDSAPKAAYWSAI